MTTDRPYQRAMKFDDAVERLKSFVGTRYDENVVAAFVAACESGQISPGRVRLKRPNADKKTAIPPEQAAILPVTSSAA